MCLFCEWLLMPMFTKMLQMRLINRNVVCLQIMFLVAHLRDAVAGKSKVKVQQQVCIYAKRNKNEIRPSATFHFLHSTMLNFIPQEIRCLSECNA